MIQSTQAVLAALFLVSACGDGSESAATASSAQMAASDAAVIETLDAFYASAGKADFDRWIDQFTDTAMFYGTDVTEAWTYAEFSASVKEQFDEGNRWNFELLDRKVTISPDGETAWYAEVAHFKNTDYTLRPTGVLVRGEDGKWRISQLVMGVPFPNAIYQPFLNGLQATALGADAETAAVTDVLSALHQYADEGRFDDYFGLFTDDAIYIGTDATERWSMDDFKGFATGPFEDGHGWTYDLIERNIVLSPMKNVAWFDELLEQEKYGTARGTGTLVRTFGGWKITQYHLTFPIPNDLAQGITAQIKNAEDR